MADITTIVSTEDLRIEVDNQSLHNPEKLYAMSQEITRLVKDNHGFSTVMLEGLLLAIAESAGLDFDEVSDLFEKMMTEVGARAMDLRRKANPQEFIIKIKTGQKLQN